MIQLKKITPIFLLGMFSIASFAQEDWKVYEDIGGKFEVNSPGYLDHSKQRYETTVGPVLTDSYVFESDEKADNFLYIINITTYPDSIFHADSLEFMNDFLEESITAIAINVNGAIKYTAESNVHDLGIGKVYRVSYDEGFIIIKGKVFAKDNLFISLQVFTTRPRALNKKIDTFLDSFELLD